MKSYEEIRASKINLTIIINKIFDKQLMTSD